MTVIAQTGSVGFAPQPAKVGTGSFTIGTDTPNWYRVKATSVDMQMVSDDRQLDLEVGGVLVPTGAYRRGVYWAGGFTGYPRLEGDFGWLLRAALGAVTTVVGDDAATVWNGDTLPTGLYQHVFNYATDQADIPWIGFRKQIPAASGGNPYGILGYDGKINAVQVTFPPKGLITARVGAVGRVPITYPDASGWTWADAFEDSDSIPTSCSGSFTIDGVSYPVTGIQMVINNGLTTPDEEAIIGSYFPDDFATRTRGVSFRFVYKWQDQDLYNAIMTGSTSGTAWTPAPFLKDSTSNPSVEIRVESPAVIPTFALPYSLGVRAGKVHIVPNGEPTLEAGGIISLDLVATVLEPNSGDEYIEIEVINEQANYTWPT